MEPFEYQGSFAVREIEVIIRSYLSAVHQSRPSDLKVLETYKESIQNNLDAIQVSLAKIKSYKYLPFESLDQAVRKTVKISDRSGERSSVRSLLIKRIESTYTKQYEYLMAQVGQFTSGGRRGNSS